jgi:soluble lytic murein transglycosylase-like protein
MKNNLIILFIITQLHVHAPDAPYDITARKSDFMTVERMYDLISREAGLNLLDSVKNGVIKELDNYHIQLLFQQARDLKIPYNILFRLVWNESRFDPNAFHNRSRASGYMQIIPATYNEITDMLGWPSNLEHTPERNIIAGTVYLKWLHDYWIDKVDEGMLWLYVLASYNAGYGNVLKYAGIPPFVETERYVKFILNT